MFNSNNWQIKLVYAGLGGLLMLIGMLLSPVTAQRDKFGEIECTSLTVVDSKGELRVALWNQFSGGRVDVFGNDGLSKATLRVTKHGGHVIANGKDGRSSADLSVWEHGGRLDVFGNDGRSKAALRVGEHGGRVDVFGNDGVSKEEYREAELIFGTPFEDAKSQVSLILRENGGHVSANGKDGESAASLGISNHGGYVFTSDRFGNTKLLD